MKIETIHLYIQINDKNNGTYFLTLSTNSVEYSKKILKSPCNKLNDHRVFLTPFRLLRPKYVDVCFIFRSVNIFKTKYYIMENNVKKPKCFLKKNSFLSFS